MFSSCNNHDRFWRIRMPHQIRLPAQEKEASADSFGKMLPESRYSRAGR